MKHLHSARDTTHGHRLEGHELAALRVVPPAPGALLADWADVATGGDAPVRTGGHSGQEEDAEAGADDGGEADSVEAGVGVRVGDGGGGRSCGDDSRAGGTLGVGVAVRGIHRERRRVGRRERRRVDAGDVGGAGVVGATRASLMFAG
jgi:hypothetical protein